MHATYPDGVEPPPLATAPTVDVPDGDGAFAPAELFAGADVVSRCCVCALGCALVLGCVKGAARNALRPVPGVMVPTCGAGVLPAPGPVLVPDCVIEGDVLGVIALTPVPGVIVPTCGAGVLFVRGAALTAGIAAPDPPRLSDAAAPAAPPVPAPALAAPPPAPRPPPPPPAAKTLLELKTAANKMASGRRMEPRSSNELVLSAECGAPGRVPRCGIGPSANVGTGARSRQQRGDEANRFGVPVWVKGVSYSPVPT
jgi:hypothetical protein